MSKNLKQKLLLTFSLLLSILTPLIGSYIKWNGEIPGYGDFPARQSSIPVPDFSPTIFWICVVLQSILISFMFFPNLLGFKKPSKSSEINKTISSIAYPSWFWFGILMFVISLLVFWGKPSILKFITPYMFVPVFWGIIIALDGIVYKRKGGKSLIATKPQTMMLLAIISSVAWFVFEYLNFFILENWYYPNDKVFTTYGNYVWYLTSYTIIFPATFEFYHLFETIPWLKDKYAYGPKITFSKTFKTFILLFGILSSILMGLYPQEFFFTIWLNPAMIMGAMLGLLGFENLFTQLKNGNWTKMLLVAISMLSIAFIWEFINWGSGFFNSDQQINASYWKYSIPYIGLIQLPFSEMPILGSRNSLVEE